jgi:replicative DNA helicase
MYITSADAENWIMRLQVRYEKKLFSECKNANDYRNAVIEINKYKLLDTECNLLDVATKYLDDYDKKSESMVKTGYNNIDGLIGGLQGGNYLILAGSTGMGKTAMALNLVINVLKQKKEVLLFSLEMTTEELLSRIISNIMEIPAANLRNRNLSEREMDKYVKFIDSDTFKELENLLKIPTTNNLNIGKIEQIVRKSKADIVFIDYLGLIRADNQRQSTYEQISDISRRLKLLAIETNKPFVVLHQLNRDMKARADKRPQLSDIRDSGKIEQDADFITFVYRPAYFDSDADKTEMQFIIGKSRHTGGAGKTANLCFSGTYQKILEVKNDF